MGSFRTYAVVQAWAQAVEQAGSFAPDAVAEALHTFQFDTVVGRIRFDQKGDVTGHNTYVWYAGGVANSCRSKKRLRSTDRHPRRGQDSGEH